MMERVKALGAKSDASWKLIDLSWASGAALAPQGPAARALAFAARALELASPAQRRYWQLRSMDPDAARLAGELCAREALRAPEIAAASAQGWRLFFSAALHPGASESVQALGASLWTGLAPKLKAGVALGLVESLGRTSQAFSPLASRLKPNDHLEAARLCAQLCAISPELLPLCRVELSLAQRSGRLTRGAEPAAQWLERRLEGVEIELCSGGSERPVEERSGGSRRL